MSHSPSEPVPSKDLLDRLHRFTQDTDFPPPPETLLLVMDAKREIERLSKPAHEREMPHCSTCSCPPYQAPEPTHYAFLIKRPRDKEAWPTIFASREGAEAYEHRASPVVPVCLSTEDAGRPGPSPEPRADLQAAAFDLIDVLDAALVGAPDTGLRVRPENYLPVMAAITRVKSITDAASWQPPRDEQG